MIVLRRFCSCLLLAACSEVGSPAQGVHAADSSAENSGTASTGGGGSGAAGAAAGGGSSAATGAGGRDSDARGDAPADRRAPNAMEVFGAYNFTLEARPVAEQVNLLVDNGYRHVSFWWQPPQPAPLEDFLADARVQDGQLGILAVLFEIAVDQGHDVARTSAAVQALGGRDIALWLLLTGQVAESDLVRVTREVADLARAAGVGVVLYPHYGHVMADAEDALSVQRAVARSNVGISLHLCHEFKAGNRDRLSDVIRNVVGEVQIATINGTDTAVDTQSEDWSRTIMPLYAGDFDVENNYLRPLWRAGYRGPLVLHTYGIAEPPEQHLRGSAERFRTMAERFD